MPTRSQRHLVAVGREASNGQGVDYDPGVITSFTAVGGLGNAKFSVTPGAGCDRVNVYRVPAGAQLDKAVHPMIPSFCTPNLPMTFYDGDPAVVNLAAGPAQLGRQWTSAAGKYTHANTNLDNRVMTSDDGVNWSGGSVPTDASPQQWQAVCWSPELNLFAAAANSGGTSSSNRIMTSPDGVNWTIRNSISANVWRSICWGGPVGAKLFVAVSSSTLTTNILTSPDGITWLNRTKPNTNILRGVCWSEERQLFVAVGDSGTGNRAFTSPDGINWTAQTTPDVSWMSVCYGNGKFVAVGASGSTERVMTSPNGTAWTLAPGTETIVAWQGVCYSPELNRFVMVGNSGSGGVARIWYSDNGTTWVPSDMTGGYGWTGVCWAKELGLFVAVNNTSGATRVATSSDGISWTVRSNLPNSPTWSGVCWSPALRKFVAVALANGVSYEKLWWAGAGAKAGETWRFGATVSDGVTLGTSGAIYTIFGNPNWELFTLTNSFGAAARRTTKTPTLDEDWVGFAVSTDAAVALSQCAIFKDSYKCAPQGIWDYYPFPATRSGVEGPGLPVVAGVVII